MFMNQIAEDGKKIPARIFTLKTNGPGSQKQTNIESCLFNRDPDNIV